MAKLVIFSADGPPVTVTLEPGTYRFGREPANAVQIDHPSVSSCHCEISVQADGRMRVRDLESTNGTLIEREPITEGVLLPGQTLTLGAVEILYEASTTAAPSIATVASRLTAASPVLQRSFYQLIPSAFAYPFSGNAGMLMVGFAAIVVIAALLPGPLAYLGMFAGFYAGLCMFAFLEDVILTSAKGDEEAPKFPTIAMERAEILELVWKFYAPAVFCFGAPILCRMYASDIPSWVTPALFGAGCVYFPMAVLAVVMSDSPGALNPIYVIPAMVRAPVAYLTMVVLFGVIGSITFGLETWIGPVVETRRWLATALGAVEGIVQIYVAIAFGRILGFFYYCFEDRLGWFTIAKDAD